jgi:hypothetical protein
MTGERESKSSPGKSSKLCLQNWVLHDCDGEVMYESWTWVGFSMPGCLSGAKPTWAGIVGAVCHAFGLGTGG